MKDQDKKKDYKFWIVFAIIVVVAVLLRSFVFEFVNISEPVKNFL